MRKTLEDIRKGLNRESLANFPNQVESEKQERPKKRPRKMLTPQELLHLSKSVPGINPILIVCSILPCLI